jgi:lysozyme
MAVLVDLYKKYNTVTDWSALAKAVSGAYIKYSDGTAGAQVPADAYVSACRSHGLPYGGYHFAQPGDPAGQADVLIAQYRRLDGALAPVLDLESGGIAVRDRTPFARAFLERVHRTYPTVVLYASGSWLAALKPGSWPYPWDRTWCAEYGVNDGTRHPVRAYSGPVDLHQYTSTGRVPGVAGGVDLSWTGTLAALLLAPPVSADHIHGEDT